MDIINGVRTLQTSFSGSILTIGNFDGVHLGHRTLISALVAKAKELKLPAVVMTFEPHPVKVLYPERHLSRIFPFDDQVEQLKALGVDALVVEPFSREFSTLSRERFLLEWIYRPFNPKWMVVGYDFSFGANRQGSIEFLHMQALRLGFGVEVIPPLKIGDAPVSSSRIRQAVIDGDATLAKSLLGRPFYLKGLIEKGAGRGRKIGVPTANVRSNAELFPGLGVYAGWAYVRDQKYRAMINVGVNPTFIDARNQVLCIEAHLPDYQGSDLYGELMTIEFYKRLRSEKKFDSVQDLVQQIHLDIENGKRALDDKLG